MKRKTTARLALTLTPLGLLLSLPGGTAAPAAPPRTAGAIFVNSPQSLGGETGWDVALADLDGDGSLDAFVANEADLPNGEASHVWFNNGLGFFSSGPILGDVDSVAVALADLDGDGDVDAFTANDGADRVWFNQGGSQGGTEGDFAPGPPLATGSSLDAALADFDNDGDLDVIVVGPVNQVWLNTGDGTMMAGPPIAAVFSNAVAVADLDGDGYRDIVVGDSATGAQNRVWWNDGNWDPGPGSFTAGTFLPTASLAQGVAIGHLDADNRLDLFFAGPGQDQIYWNEGTRSFITAGPLTPNDTSWDVALADVDGDGDLDAVVANGGAGNFANQVYLNQGGRTFVADQAFGANWTRGIALADLTGDGLPDVFEANTGEDRVWFNQLPPPLAGPSWQVQTVEQRGITGLGSSIALDDAGRPHITYVEFIARPTEDDFRLFYATWDGELWHTDQVDTGFLMAESTSLALDSQGRPHIAYESNEDLSLKERVRYATWDGSQWQRQTVHPNAETGGHFSLALDPQDRPHVTFYHGLEQRLEYARWDGGQWQLEIVDEAADVGRFNSLAVDGAGNPHVAYHDYSAQELKYATRSGGGLWQIEVVDGTVGTGEYASLALDSAGRPHIGYESDGRVRYARHNGTTWEFEDVPLDFTAAERTVLALDANDDPHLIWNIFPWADVWYGRRDGPGWHTEVAATTPFWRGQDLAVDASLTPHVAFHHSEYGDLRYAVLDEPWRLQPFDSPGLVERPSLALPVGGYLQTPDFSYYKPTAGLLRHGAWEEAMWQFTPVDFISASGADPSLAIGNDGRPRVSYYDADSQQLRYAAWDGAAWQSEVVDLTVGAGRFSNLLLEGARPDIVYWDDNVRRIRLASWDPFANSWSFTINLAGPPTAAGSGYLSAARLSDGRIAASYFHLLPSDQAGVGNLRLATWDGQSWTDTFIAGGLEIDAPHNALAVDAVENEPAVAYYRQSSQEVIFAFRQGGLWQSQTAAGNVNGLTGLALQLALDSRRQPRIAYAAADALRLASGQDGVWRNELVYQEAGVTLNGVSLGIGRRQHLAVGTSSGLRYVATVAAAGGPEPWILTPYDPVSPWLACFEFLFDPDPPQPAAAAPAPAAGGGNLDDLGIFLQMTPLFRATAGGQHYVDLYGDHVQEMTAIVLDDRDLLGDSFGTLQNFLPGLEALVSGQGSEVLVTQAMVDDALDIWTRLAAAGGPTLAADIQAELDASNDLQDFVGLTFDEWAQAIGVSPPSHRLYLPVVPRN